MILDYIKKFGKALKKDIEKLLFEKLSDALSEKQKKNKIRNMLHLMAKKDKSIICYPKGTISEWHLLDEKNVTLDDRIDEKNG